MLSACANPIPPSGGPEDIDGPQLRTTLSTPNEQTNFYPSEIVLTFDEWIKLSDPANQILISPPLQKRPSFKSRGKEVIIEFDEEEKLKENTTYTIQFGESIQDITEGNATEDFRFIFATGPVLDSLELTGRVVEIDRKTAVENALVMLYTRMNDSLVYLEKPAYATKTNVNGYFTLKNLRADTFKIVALTDENRNYLFEPASEAIAFSEEPIYLTDTFSSSVSLVLFKEETKVRLTGKRVYTNKVVLQWKGSLDQEDVQLPDWDVKLIQWWPDSAVVWLNQPLDSVSLIIDQDKNKDTIAIKRGRRVKTDTAGVLLQKSRMSIPVNSRKDTLLLPWNRPITSFDPDGIVWKDTTDEWRALDVQQRTPDQIAVYGAWTTGAENQIILLPGSLTNINGRSLTDTLRYSFFVPHKDKLGTIIFVVNSMGDEEQKIIELMQGPRMIDRWILTQADTGTTINVPFLRPGKYTLNNIIDSNENGQWDTGDYLRGRQPERMWSRELEPLRENWDLKVELEY